jgi:hypothetical protein
MGNDWTGLEPYMHTSNLNLQEQAPLQAFPQSAHPDSHPMPTPIPTMPGLPTFSLRQCDNSGGMACPGRIPSMSGMGSNPGPSTAMFTPYPHQYSYFEAVPPGSIPVFRDFPAPTQATSTQGIVYPQTHQSGDWGFVESKGTSQSRLTG